MLAKGKPSGSILSPNSASNLASRGCLLVQPDGLAGAWLRLNAPSVIDLTATSSSVRTFFLSSFSWTSHRRKHSSTVSAVTSLGTSSRSWSLSLSRSAQALGEISSFGGFASVGCGASETSSGGAGGFASAGPAGGATSSGAACASVADCAGGVLSIAAARDRSLSFGCPRLLPLACKI